jgi:hypothetical protein
VVGRRDAPAAALAANGGPRERPVLPVALPPLQLVATAPTNVPDGTRQDPFRLLGTGIVSKSKFILVRRSATLLLLFVLSWVMILMGHLISRKQ